MPSSPSVPRQPPSGSDGHDHEIVEIEIRHFDLPMCLWLRRRIDWFELKDPFDGYTVPRRRAHYYVGHCILRVKRADAVVVALKFSGS